MRRRTASAVVAGVTLVASLSAPAGAVVQHADDATVIAPAARPNIVVIMVDDMSSELVGYMSEVKRLQREAVRFRNYFVSNSLCCPSRATYMTGKYPHNSKVTGNYWPKGGFGRFLENDIETSIGPYLSAAGYRTGLMGKYLNQYEPAGDIDGVNGPAYPSEYVPPGWDEWFVPGSDGYQQFDYQVVDSVDGDTSLVDYTGHAEENYFTDVMADRAGEFIERATSDPDAAPFFLSLTPFSVHGGGGDDPQQPDGPRFPPAPRDRADSPNRPAGWGEPQFAGGDCGRSRDGGCDDVAFPDPSWGSFNQLITDPPEHLPTEPLTPAQIDSSEADHLERVQMAQGVNDLIADVRADLDRAGVADETYIVFTSDNGFHMGEHALSTGKGMPYDHDVRVPLVFRPPGGTAQSVRAKIAQNTDLLPTIADIADAELPGGLDGRSLLPLVEGEPAGPWRRTAFVEYTGYEPKPLAFKVDPDRGDALDHAPPYVALRTKDYLYVDYGKLDGRLPRTAKAEYFDLDADPYMLHNIYRDLRHGRRINLNDAAIDYAGCGGNDCWAAGRAAP